METDEITYIPQQENNAPAKRDVTYVNQCESKNNSVYRKLLNAERQDLIRTLDDKNLDSSYVCWIPNGKFVWINRVIKDAIGKGVVNACDLSLVKTIWMQPGQKEKLIAVLEKFTVDRNKNTSHSSSYPTKSKYPVTCDLKTGALKIPMKNPGLFNMETGEMEEYQNYDDMMQDVADYNYRDIGGKAPASYQQYQPQYKPTSISKCLTKEKEHDSCACDSMPSKNMNTGDFIKFFDNYVKEKRADEHYMHAYRDNDYVNLLGNIFFELDNRKWDMQAINALVEKLFKSWSRTQRINYIYYVLNPWANKLSQEARIPSAIPFPTAALAVTTKFTVTTNATGYAAFAINPFYATSTALTTVGVNNAATLNGSASDNNFLGVITDLVCPITIYDQYRLVSSAICCRYVGTDLNNSGSINVSLVPLSAGNAPVLSGIAVAGYAKYGNFSQVDNGYFTESMPCNKEGSVNCIWYTPDLAAQNMQFFGTALNTNIFIGNIRGGPSSAPALEIELICNFECIVDSTGTDWISKQVYKSSYEELEHSKRVISQVINSGARGTEIISKASEYANIAQDVTKIPTDNLEQLKMPKHKTKHEHEQKTFLREALDYVVEKVPAFIFQAAKTAIAPELDIAARITQAIMGMGKGK